MFNSIFNGVIALFAGLIFSTSSQAVQLKNWPFSASFDTSGEILSAYTIPDPDFPGISINAIAAGATTLTFNAAISIDPSALIRTYHQPYIGGGLNVTSRPIENQQLRISNWSARAEVVFTDAKTGTVLRTSTQTFTSLRESQSYFGYGVGISDMPDALHPGAALRVFGTLTVSPGSSLVASNDPSCASFSCMEIVRDSFSLEAWANAGLAPVPEPSTTVLLLIGTALVALRRR